MSSVPRIVIITGNHVCHNPRALKEAEALAEHGFEVIWLGGWFDARKAERDRKLLKGAKWKFRPVTDWPFGVHRGVTRQWQRIRRKLAAEAYDRLNFESPLQLGYGVPELLRSALSEPADLYIAHSEPAMWVAVQLLDRGRRVGVDMEDWFSEDLLPGARRGRPIKLLKTLEKILLTKSVYKTCPSRVMSRALANEYQCEPPAVIYNAFPWSDREKLDGQIKDRRDCSIPSIHWFSQTLGPGRGLEDFFRALPFLEHNVEIHLRGESSPASQRWMEKSIPAEWQNCIFIHPLVHNDELLSRIAEHDVGFAGEPNTPPNKNLTVSNKILQYLLAGLAVVASNTVGHREVADQAPGAITLYPSGDSAALARSLTTLLRNSERLLAAKAAALSAAKEVFCWERMRDRLAKGVDQALNRRLSTS